MPPEIVDVDTPHGRVRVKFSDTVAFAPEYEDCRRIAVERGIPLKTIMTEATVAAASLAGKR